MSYSFDTKPSGSSVNDLLGFLELWADTLVMWSNGGAYGSVIESYSEINRDNFFNIYSSSSIYAGQAFQSPSNIALGSCQFYLSQANSPSGSMTAYLYAVTGVLGVNALPTGSPLATSESIDTAILSTTFQLINFNFTGVNQYNMVSGTNYGIVLKYSGPASIHVGIDASAPSHAGNDIYQSGGSFVSLGTDVCFYVRGVGTVASQSYTWANPQTYSNDTKPSAGSFVNDAKP